MYTKIIYFIFRVSLQKNKTRYFISIKSSRSHRDPHKKKTMKWVLQRMCLLDLGLGWGRCKKVMGHSQNICKALSHQCTFSWLWGKRAMRHFILDLYFPMMYSCQLSSSRSKQRKSTKQRKNVYKMKNYNDLIEGFIVKKDE